MPAYEYVCLACERTFEERRPMGSNVSTTLACPGCSSDRVRRRFSFVAQAAPSSGGAPAASGGCCGGACGCG